MFEIIFLLVVSAYFLANAFIIIGMRKKFEKSKKSRQIYASVIVAARNEEKNILKCMESLDALIYTPGKLEILIVDDSSTDQTGLTIDEYIKDKEKFRKITVKEQHGNLKGKVNALAEGIKASKGEIILVTDADCIVGPLWVETIVSYYDTDTGIVNGFTTQKIRGGFSGMQAVDFIYLLAVASGTINQNLPISCIGNNMSFRKRAYLETGGYEKLPFSVTEDSALLNAINRLKKYTIKYPVDKDSMVISEPCKNIRELVSQKKRWAVGGIDVSVFGKVVMSIAFFAGLFVFLTPLFFSSISLYLAVFKIAVDYFFLLPVHNELGLGKNLRYFILFEIYLTIYVVSLPVLLIFSRTVTWKGRKY